MALEDIFIEIG